MVRIFLQHRWKWGLAIAMLVLLVGAPLAWRFRPLNSTERQLVGIWTTPSAGEQPSYMILGADRRMTHGSGLYDPARRHGGLTREMDGTWEASGGAMYGTWKRDLPTRLRDFWQGVSHTFHNSVRMEGTDVLKISTADGRNITWIRVSDQPIEFEQE